MPKYLPISDDLQLIPGDGGRFVSRTGKDLIVAEAEAQDWLTKNPRHPNRSQVEVWLDGVDLEQHRRRRKREEVERLARKKLEKPVEKLVKGLMKLREKNGKPVSEEAARKIVRASLDGEMD